MENRKRWLGTLAVIVVAIAAVGSIGAFTFGWHGGGPGFGMMGGMHGSWGWGGNASGESITNEEAVDAAENFVATYGGETLELAEVMVFDNHFYAQAAELETGRYAYEFLIDRYSGRISLEPGPNMMWNEKYGHMSGGMMGFFRGAWSEKAMPVSEEEAVAAAQAYLDRYVPGLQVDDHAAAFYGYYTLHTIRDGETVGMLSVNGYTGAVWLHSWHGVYLGEALDDNH
jgi:hypothetical protein